LLRIEQIGVELFQRLFYKIIPKKTQDGSKFLCWLDMAILGRILRLEAAIYSDEIPIAVANDFINELKKIVKN